MDPTGYSRGRTYAHLATVVAAHEYVGNCRPNGTRELLCAVRLVQRGGEQ